ncbi:MAG: hypothetical protein LCH79_20725 [Proteobacteria bacterium]|nr:hypothetical protein [Pseudomonadota bacterium]
MTPQINLARWKPHLMAAKRQGKSMKAYAAEHGLSHNTLYVAARALREAANKSQGKARLRPRRAAGAFAAVRLTPCEQQMAHEPVPRLTVQLPNGVVLHLEGTGMPAQIPALVAALGGLPCSA